MLSAPASAAGCDLVLPDLELGAFAIFCAYTEVETIATQTPNIAILILFTFQPPDSIRHRLFRPTAT
jgi:hypothetical protein